MPRTLIIVATQPTYQFGARLWNAYHNGRLVVEGTDRPVSEAAKSLLRDELVKLDDVIVCRVSGLNGDHSAMMKSVEQLVANHTSH